MVVNRNVEKRVLLGMSGGVDSLTAAILLQDEGYEVVGLTLHFQESRESHMKDQHIKKITEKLHIKHHFLDVSGSFEKQVLKYVKHDHESGRTPSPCVVCNPSVKLKALTEEADKLQCQHIATGHYIQIKKYKNHTYICKARDEIKDQSYFLWNVPEKTLSLLITPLGNFTKSHAREMASRRHFHDVAVKKESMGLCFSNKNNYQSVLKTRLAPGYAVSGPVVDRMDHIVGRHDGAAFYTIGQQKGIKWHKKLDGYVVAVVDTLHNKLIVDHWQHLYQHSFEIADYHFINMDDVYNYNIQTRVRGVGRNPEGFCKLEVNSNNRIKVILDQPAWAVAPGQPAVFYVNDRLIGGGFVV